MAYQAKTTVQPLAVAAFLDSVTPPDRQAEARHLVQLFGAVTGFAPVLYSGGMVGFGRYAYRYATGHSGVSLATGFAPRKADLSIYIMPGYHDFSALLARLGKHRMGKACLYLRHLSDADEAVLCELIVAGLAALKTHWPVEPT
ncbi:MAG: DUF1801 domain-containing protein [bacterium]